MQPGAKESHKSQRTSRTPPIPLRPELIGFLNPQSLGLMSCASAALRKDVLDSKAWELMAIADDVYAYLTQAQLKAAPGVAPGATGGDGEGAGGVVNPWE